MVSGILDANKVNFGHFYSLGQHADISLCLTGNV